MERIRLSSDMGSRVPSHHLIYDSVSIRPNLYLSPEFLVHSCSFRVLYVISNTQLDC